MLAAVASMGSEWTAALLYKGEDIEMTSHKLVDDLASKEMPTPLDLPELRQLVLLRFIRSTLRPGGDAMRLIEHCVQAGGRSTAQLKTSDGVPRVDLRFSQAQAWILLLRRYTIEDLREDLTQTMSVLFGPASMNLNHIFLYIQPNEHTDCS
jgi:hypothetical protein